VDVRSRQLAREAFQRFCRPAPAAAASSRTRLDDYLDTLFPAQRALVEDWSPQLAVLGTRRAGKSKMVPAKLLRAGEKWPGTVSYYLHPDGGGRAAETLLGPDVNIERICAEYDLPWRYNGNKLKLTHTGNGSEIRLRGADDVREAKKYRGDKVALVVLEESQNFPANIFKALAEDILGPALADVGGQMMPIGTPGEICAGYWYDITRNDVSENADGRLKRLPGWSVFEWSVLDNPTIRHNVAPVIARKLLRHTDKSLEALTALLLTDAGRAWAMALEGVDPSVTREWFGRWVNDAGALFYAYESGRNDYSGTLPAGHTWMHVLGVDLGHDDAFAMEVLAFSSTCEELYEVAHFKKSGLTPAEWAARVKDFRQRYNPIATVVDTGGLGKAIVEEWKTREGIPAEAAEKSGKPTYVKMLNGDLRAGVLKVLAGGPWASEMAALPKDPNSPPHKPPEEHPAYANHCCDAGLYAWREALHWLGRTPEAEPEKGTDDWHRKQAEKREQDLAAQLEREMREEQDAW
jgi:hypothetical protein